MMGVGKSTVGKILSKACFNFIDVDKIIEKKKKFYNSIFKIKEILFPKIRN